MSNQIISFNELRKMVGNKSRTTIWRWERAGIFPRRIQIGPNSIGWKLDDVKEWLEIKIDVGSKNGK